MADLLSKEMLADLIINIINILILFFVSRALLYKPVKAFLDKRRKAVDDERKQVQKLKADAKAKQEKYNALMADSAAIRTDTMRRAEKQAQKKADEIVAAAEREAAEIRQTGAAEAAAARDKMLADAKEQLGVLAVELSGKILSREVTDEDNRRIIDSFFGDLG